MRPNFFLIGAAKSGTTSLYHYLRQHPSVFMSPVKEPNFFAFLGATPKFAGPPRRLGSLRLDGRSRRARYASSITTWDQYERLFRDVRDEEAIGESSVSYLYFPECAKRIREHVPNAKIVAILRNPIERAWSQYRQLVRDGNEPCESFESALAAEAERIKAGWAPPWFYTDRGFYCRQLRVYFELFPKSDIHVVLHEDLDSNPQAVCRNLFAFLGVDANLRIDTALRHNVSQNERVPRHATLHHVLTSEGRLGRTLRALGETLALRPLRSWVHKALTKRPDVGATQMSPDTHNRLLTLFQSDIESLESLIGRDLSAWRRH